MYGVAMGRLVCDTESAIVHARAPEVLAAGALCLLVTAGANPNLPRTHANAQMVYTVYGAWIGRQQISHRLIY